MSSFMERKRPKMNLSDYIVPYLTILNEHGTVEVVCETSYPCNDS